MLFTEFTEADGSPVYTQTVVRT